MPAPQVVTAAIEASVNQALKWASNSQLLLAPLADKSCLIFVQELKVALIFRFTAANVNVGADIDNIYASSPNEDGPNALQDNECWVSISLFAIDKLKQNNQLTKLIKAGKLDFSGDLAILQAVSRLFDKIDIDFEEVLSTFIGDAAAYQLNTSGKKALGLVKSQFTAFTQTIADAALDEKPIAVRPIMVMNFNDEVNVLRADVDRFEARLQQLEQGLNAKVKTTKTKGQSL